MNGSIELTWIHYYLGGNEDDEEKQTRNCFTKYLDIRKDGACKTKIVHQSNLNFRTVNPYIDLPIKNNLLKVRQGKNVLCETTIMGKNLLDDFKQIDSQLSE